MNYFSHVKPQCTVNKTYISTTHLILYKYVHKSNTAGVRGNAGQDCKHMNPSSYFYCIFVYSSLYSSRTYLYL